MSGKTAQLDEALLLMMRNADDLSIAIGPHWLSETARDVTALGSIVWLFSISFVLMLIKVFGENKREAWFILFSAIGSWALSFSLKYFFSRNRPQLISSEVEVYSQSFPSAHALMTITIFSAMSLIFSQSLNNKSQKVTLWVSTIIIIAAVGVSRLYLGVHWATDVIAGWTLGAALVLALWYWLKSKTTTPSE